jgi:hypothetical protein
VADMSDEEQRLADISGGFACGEHGCRSLSPSDGQALWDEAMRQKATRAERMPDETAAVRALCDAYQRLKELGWKEVAYVPKHKHLDGIDMIECGSSGIHSGYHDEHGFWINDANDTWPSRPVLYRVAV